MPSKNLSVAGFRRVLLLGLLLAMGGCGRSESPAARRPLFDFQRLNTDGTLYRSDGDYVRHPWACVTDRLTGLTWEVKSPRAGLRFKDNTYTWYNPDERGNGGDAGMRNGGHCTGSACDTQSYVNAVNAQGLCGYRDWRVPLRTELAALNDPRIKHPGPTIDPRFFPDTRADEYWSGTAYGFHYAGAWAWNFSYGYDRVDWKKSPKYLRLVRGTLTIRLKDPDQ